MRRNLKLKNKVLSVVLCCSVILGTAQAVLGADTPDKDKTSALSLEASVTDGEDYSVDLSWNNISTDSKKYGYRVLRSSDDGETWETRSSWNVGEKVKVLNVHPNRNSESYLKNWMNRVVDSETGEAAGKGLFEIDTVLIDDYNVDADKYLLDENGDYQYDVIFFGSYDSNGGKDLTESSFECTQKFIDSGRGVLFGHDTVCMVETVRDQHKIFAQFADQLGIIATEYWEEPDRTTKANVVKTGLLTAFPWTIEGELTIPTTHVWGQYSGGTLKATVWMTLDNRYPEPASVYPELAEIGAKRNAYLVSNNQLAMIQTGHSNGAASDDECMVLANTMFYLKQLTTVTSARDNSFYDITAPEKPVVSLTHDASDETSYSVTAHIAGKDLGTKYQYRTEALPYVAGEDSVLSNIVETEAFADIKGFVVIQTETKESASGLLEYESDGVTVKNVKVASDRAIDYKMESLENGKEYYLHVFAVDNAGNVSEETIYSVSDKEAVKQYTVVFLNDDGTVLSEQKVNEGMAAEEPATPVKAADEKYTYEFIGWDKAFDNVVSDLTVTAQFKAVEIPTETTKETEETTTGEATTEKETEETTKKEAEVTTEKISEKITTESTTQNQTTTQNIQTNSPVKTGDDMRILAVLMILITSGCAVVIVKGKKEKESDC